MNELVNARLELFPITATIEGDDQNEWLSIDKIRVSELAQKYKTPLYIYDRATLDDAVQQYNAALKELYPGDSGITYAGKAYLSLAIAQWAGQNNLWLDCTGVGELEIAQKANLSKSVILVHGVNKSFEDLNAAIQKAGTIVVDNLTELTRLSDLAKNQVDHLPDLWLRLRPGMAVDTHGYTQTGQVESKFGMSVDEIKQAVKICLDSNLPLTGLHFHLGSHFHELAPLEPAIETTLDLLKEIKTNSGWEAKTICTGGGWGIAYHEDNLPHPSVKKYVQFISEHLINGCRNRQLDLPKLQVEPGRSLVARAGVAIYRVGAVKDSGIRQWTLVDGGMADNIRPALYGAKYSALPLEGIDRHFLSRTWIAGPYCESSDVLIEDLPMPNLQPDEYIAIPASGAYHISMSGNYNGARRPAVLWIDRGKVQLVQRRESLEELYQRDLPL